MASHLQTHSKSIQNGLKELHIDQRKFKKPKEKKNASYPMSLPKRSIPNFLFEEGEKQNEGEDNTRANTNFSVATLVIWFPNLMK